MSIYNNAGENVLQIYDVSKPANPVKVGAVNTGQGSNYSPVAVSGRYAYTAGYGFQVIDISDPANPVAAGSINQLSLAVRVFSVAVAGLYAFVVNPATYSMQFIDVSNPANPVSVGTVHTGANPQSMAISGRYAYVANWADSTLQVFDLGGAYIQPLEAGTIETGTLQTRDTATVGNDLNVRGGLTVGGTAHITGGLSVNDITGGLTTNIVVTVPTGTKTLYFTNGVLRAAQ